MSSTLPLALILLAVLTSSLFFLIRGEGGVSEIPRLLERVGINIDQLQEPTVSQAVVKQKMSPEFVSGTSRYSQGSCSVDNDCMTAGCSGEVCSNDAAVITTCEFNDSFPNAQGLTCGCVSGICGWQ